MKLVPTLVLPLLLSSLSLAQEAKAAPSDAEVIAKQGPSYPLTTCPISHEALDAMGKPVEIVHEGRLVRLCCKSCVKEFKQDPAATLKTIDEAVIAAQRDSYPLKTCVVSGEELGGMGAPKELVYGTRLVRLCCKSCVKGFQKDPASFLAQVDAALIAEQKKTYPLTTCVVSGEALEGDATDHLYGTRLVRFCCSKCAKGFEQEPAKYLAALDKASGDKKAAPQKN